MTTREGEMEFFPTGDFLPPCDFSETAWDKVQNCILSFLRLKEDWDGDGAPRISTELVRSALELVRQMMKSGHPAPNDVYPLPDGLINLEWHLPNKVIERVEIQGIGVGELMRSFPDRPAEFEDYMWSLPRRVRPVPSGGKCSDDKLDSVKYADEKDDTSYSSGWDYQMAA